MAWVGDEEAVVATSVAVEGTATAVLLDATDLVVPGTVEVEALVGTSVELAVDSSLLAAVEDRSGLGDEEKREEEEKTNVAEDGGLHCE